MPTVILHHGFMGGGFGLGPVRWRSFHGIDRAIARLGNTVGLSEVHPTAGIESRAGQLKRWIDDRRGELGEGPYVLFAHSLGGLDARYMISHLGMAQRVSTLVTICTPHRGTAISDWILSRLGQRAGILKKLDDIGLDLQVLHDTSRESCARFNEQTLDAGEVRYYSVAAALPWRKLPPHAIPLNRLIEKAEGPNDGLVSVQSARWGTFLGTWPVAHARAMGRGFTFRGGASSAEVIAWYLDILSKVLEQNVPRRSAIAPIVRIVRAEEIGNTIGI